MVRWVVSGIVVAALVEMLVDQLKTWGGSLLGWGFVILSFGLLVAFVLMFERHVRTRPDYPTDIDHVVSPQQYRGLIFMFSNEHTFRKAIEYHRDTLETCWVLVTPKKSPLYEQTRSEFLDSGITFIPMQVRDRYDTENCYEVIRSVYERQARIQNLHPQEIISDITGGTKPMTMGMILACVENGYPIEHIPTQFHPVTDRPLRPLDPIEIRVQHVKEKVQKLAGKDHAPDTITNGGTRA